MSYAWMDCRLKIAYVIYYINFIWINRFSFIDFLCEYIWDTQHDIYLKIKFD